MLLVVLLVRHVAVLEWHKHWLLDRTIRNSAATRRWRHGEPTNTLALRRAARVLPLRRRDHACCWCTVLHWRHCRVLLLVCCMRRCSHSGCMVQTVRMRPALCIWVRCLRESLGGSSPRRERRMGTGIALWLLQLMLCRLRQLRQFKLTASDDSEHCK
jgi:hypothetical protein